MLSVVVSLSESLSYSDILFGNLPVKFYNGFGKLPARCFKNNYKVIAKSDPFKIKSGDKIADEMAVVVTS